MLLDHTRHHEDREASGDHPPAPAFIAPGFVVSRVLLRVNPPGVLRHLQQQYRQRHKQHCVCVCVDKAKHSCQHMRHSNGIMPQARAAAGSGRDGYLEQQAAKALESIVIVPLPACPPHAQQRAVLCRQAGQSNGRGQIRPWHI